MLAFLGYHALSKASIINSNPKQDKAIFNLVYQNDKNEQSLTHDMDGFYVAIRPWVGAGPGDNVLLLSKSQTVNDFTITPTVEKVSGEEATQVKLKIKYTGSKLIRFDLGVFADASLGSDDDAVVSPRSDARGFYIKNKQDPSNTCTFIVNGQYFPSVSTIYIGTDNTVTYKDPVKYPFFQDQHDKESTGDSVFGFSWKSITMNPNQEADLGFLVIIGDKVDLRPIIKDNTAKPEHGFDPTKPVELAFEAANYEENQEIQVIITVDNEKVYDEKFSPEKSKNYAKLITTRVTLGDKTSISYTAKAIEVKDGKFSEVSGTIKATKIPKLVITTKPKELYAITDKIKISGYVEDEAYAEVYYEIDSYGQHLIQSINNLVDGKLKFTDIEIDMDLNMERGGDYYLYIWALDDTRSKSNVEKFKFTIKPPPEPTLYSAYCSDRKVFKGQEVVIYGEADDPDVGQLLTVSVRGKYRDDFVTIGNFTVQNSLIPFAFFYTIPDLSPGNAQKISVKVQDATQLASSYITIYIDVYDPSKPQPPPALGNFTNEFENLLSNDENTNACFNPYFKPNAQEIDNPITSNELGIFAAYRKRDLAIGPWRLPGETKLIYGNKEKMDKSYGPDEKLRITPFTRYEDVTGYFQLCWNVTNLGYFKEYFDLGCFYDSYLEGNDNNTIIPREDGRGISLYSFGGKLADVSYTILWKDYGNLPSISTFSLMPTKVGEGGYIDPSDMPFFNSSRKYPEGNAMVAFAWQNYQINGGETLTFGVTFAPAANIKTPTRIIDQTKVQNGIAEAGKDINLNFQISDGDAGETIHIKLTVNGTNVIVDQDYNVTSDAIKISKNVKVGTVGKFFTYEIVAQDTDNRFVTKKVNTLPLTQQPILLLDKQGMKSKYFRGYLPLTIKGTVVDDDSVVIKYAFDNGRDLVAGKVEPKKDGSTFEFNVTYPDELKNGKHFMDVWAEDEYGIRTSQIRDTKNVNTSRVVFELADLHKPHMLNAGFNTKKAKLNDNLIAFSFVESANTGVMVITQVKFNKGKWMNMNNAYQVQSPAKPMAWYYTITNLAKGDHSVEFRVVDQDGLPSDNTIKRTIHIE